MNKLIRFAITGLLLSWIGWKTDWKTVGQAFMNLNVGYWLAAVALLVAAQLVSALRWQIFARQLGIERSFWQLTRYYFIGMYFNLLLPTSVGGDVVRILYLNGKSGKKLRAAAAVMLDRVNGLIVLVAVACVAVLFAPPDLPAWVTFSVFGIAGAGLCGTLGLAAIARWGRLNDHRKAQVGMFWEVVRHPRSLVATTLLSLVVQVASAAIVWFVAQGLSLNIPLWYYAVFVPMVSLMTLLPSVAGMGVREEGCALFLAPLGIDSTTAVTLAILWFAVQIAVSLLGGLVYLFGHDTEVKKTPRDTEVEHGTVDHHSDQGRTRQLDRAA